MKADVGVEPPSRGLIRALMGRRSRVAIGLTIVMLVLWGGYLLLIPFAASFLALQPTPGISVAYLLGASIIVIAVIMTGIYVYWANRVYDPARARLRATGGE